MTITGFRPLRDFMTLRDAMDRFLDDSFAGPGSWYNLTGGNGIGTRYLPVDVYETPEEIVVRAHVPGVTPEHLEVNYQQGVLSLRAKSDLPETHESWRWYVHELSTGEVVRQIQLPRTIDVDKAKASFENGVLTLALPKAAEAKARQIPIGSSAQITPGSEQS